MSGRGTMTSRTTVSPKSMIEWMKARSVVLDDVLGVGHVGHRQQLGLGHVRPASSSSPGRRPMSRLARPMRTAGDGPDRREPDDGGDERGAEQRGPLGVVHGPVLRHGLEDDEDDHDLEDRRRPRRPSAPNQSEARTPTRVAETSWQMRTSRRTGLRNARGARPGGPSCRAPRRLLVEQRLGLAPCSSARGWSRPGPGTAEMREQDHDRRRSVSQSTRVGSRSPPAITGGPPGSPE